MLCFMLQQMEMRNASDGDYSVQMMVSKAATRGNQRL